jgi:hypothetical protein
MNFGERRTHIADHLTRWAYTQHVYKVPSRELTDHLIDFLATEWAAEEEINIDRDVQPILENHFPLTIPPPARPTADGPVDTRPRQPQPDGIEHGSLRLNAKVVAGAGDRCRQNGNAP